MNQGLGEGILSIFGAPLAHEDHALRACYAALAMQAAMRDSTEEVRRTQGMPLQVRVGLNSGEVVVRTIGNDLPMDYSAVGPTTHLAARMEQLATPGRIPLIGTTLQLVEGLIRGNALGPIPITGMTEPVDVYELTGASTIKRRLQAAAARGLSQFVGRDTEIEALPLLERAVAQSVAMNTMATHALLVAYLSQGYLHAGRIQAATDQAGRALAYSRVHKERGHEAYALRLLGDMARRRDFPDIEQAETHYQQALTLANELGIRPLQAHCHRDLGILYSQTGQIEQARAALATAIERYRDMAMTFWLPETEAALAQVERQ